MIGVRHSCSRAVCFTFLLLLSCFAFPSLVLSQSTRLLRQPTLSSDHVAFTYGADIWVVDREGGEARRITSTPAVESDPHFSPDGRNIAFTSNRSGTTAVYLVPVEGGQPRRLTWYPAPTYARGWTPDGSRVLYASTRQTAPTGYERLWTVSPAGGPSELIPAPWGHDGSYAPNGGRLVVDRVSRWDVEWRSYRGGQNTPLVILDLESLEEVRLPNERTTDIQPIWMGDKIYFLSDRDWAMNVWSYQVSTGNLEQVTSFSDVDVKWLAGNDGSLILEHDGYLLTLDPESGDTQRLEITVRGDFPWAEARWEDVSDAVANASLSPTGKRVIMEARGEIFTVPVENGSVRNLTQSSGVADRAPVWSPDGGDVAWISDDGSGYVLLVGSQDGTGEVRRISIGESRMAWTPVWSPDGEMIAFVDDDTRIRVVDVSEGRVRTVDVGGTNFERTSMGLAWSPDSKWLAYAKTFPNNFGRIVVWSVDSGDVHPLTDPMAHAVSPSWDRDGRHLYFLASTNLALGSGWANTSSMMSDPTYGAYVLVLRADDPTPFPPESDEEEIKAEEEEGPEGGEPEEAEGEEEAGADKEVRIDLDGIERRVISLPMPVAAYGMTLAGPEGTVFIGERPPGEFALTLHKFSLEEREASEFTRGVMAASVSADGSKMLLRSGPGWQVVDTGHPPEPGSGGLDFELRTYLDRRAEWGQMFDEAWHYEEDFFYDPGLHGADWDAVRDRYRPLVSYVQHRSDLNYILDQMNGELSVGHSFVFGGDFPAVDTVRVGLLGADFEAVDGGWQIARIFTSESWNPGLGAPLDRPGLEVAEGDFLVGVDGDPLTGSDDPYRLLDGTAGRQTVLHLNDRPGMDGHWTVTVEPIRNENALRQRNWVEDNRRRVDELSGGRLGYVWVPNTGGPGVVSFDRYFFAQQDKEGAVIDERFNGGGNLDDYMVDLMTRSLRGAITNEAEGGAPFRLPAGILGPKVLLINEMAGSGGDYFPWAFRQQNAGPLIGARTWGGLVRSSVHNSLIDGGALTSPDNAVFDPLNNRYVAENEGVPPDIEVLLDARSVAAGRDPQLERGVQEALRLLEERGTQEVRRPPFPRPHRRPGG
ncbi:MAG: PDZ domain-containing protein, partial [Gemmatimonadota bacterium]